MPLTIACPGCMKRYTLGEEFAGRTARCKDCGQVFTVPGAAAKMAAVVPDEFIPVEPPRVSRPATTDPPPARPLPARPTPPPPPAAGPASLFDDLLEEDEEPVFAGGLPPSRMGYRRSPDGSALRLTLMILGGLTSAALFFGGLFWIATNLGSWMPGGTKIAVNPNAPAGAEGGGASGWPALIPAPSNLYAAGTNPTQRPKEPTRKDAVDKTVRSIRSLMGFLNEMSDAFSTIHDGPSAQAAMARLEQIKTRMQTGIEESKTLPRTTRAEDRAVAEQTKDLVRSTLDRLRKESERLTSLPGGSVGAIRMMRSLDGISSGFERMIDASGAEAAGAQPYVEVYVANVPDQASADWISNALQSPTLGRGGSTGSYSATLKASAARIWPVSDPRLFAQAIPFGTAEVSGHRITILNPTIDAQQVAALQETKRQEEAERKARSEAQAKASAEREAQRAIRQEKADPKPPPGADAITVSVTKLKSTNGFRVREGLTELARMIPKEGRHKEVVPAVIAHATGTDHFNAIEAIKALANWRDEVGVAAMAHVIERSEDTFVRREAMEQLGRMKEGSAATAIAERLKSDWPASENALRAMGAVAEPAVITMLKAPDSQLRKAACEVLADIGGQASLDTMLALPADPDRLVQMAASAAMTQIAQRLGPEAVQKLNRGRTRKR